MTRFKLPAPATVGVNGAAALSLDEHVQLSRQIQKQADKWLIAGSVLIGATLTGLLGLAVFMRGIGILRRAERTGLSVRPMIVTLIGYMVFIDGALNTFGWITDLLANHNLLWRTFMTAWGNFFDGGYFWHYNEIGLGGAAAPGEKAWEICLMLTMFPMRMAACIGFLQMKRWGHQWMVVTCWMGVMAWVGYIANMTVFADIRFDHVVAPVWGWWLFDIFYITPFLAIPYLHTVNREVFTD
jgi:hypothetical protein